MAIRTVIVTGSNSGIGFEAVKLFLQKGYHVIMACRSRERTQPAMDQLSTEHPGAMLTFLELDLSSLDSVRKFVTEFRATGKQLNILVNNAGMSYSMKDTNRATSVDGFEMTMATNHLGHFLLTGLLLEDLKSTAESCGEARIVVVASRLHDRQHWERMGPVEEMDEEDLMMEKSGAYTGAQGYKNSKLANVLFTRELAKRLEGTNVTVNCLCPGFIPETGLMRHSSAFTQFFVRKILVGFIGMFRNINTRSPSDGGRYIFQLATDEKLRGVNGKYFKEDSEDTPSMEVDREGLQQKLWDWSARQVRLEP